MSSSDSTNWLYSLYSRLCLYGLNPNELISSSECLLCCLFAPVCRSEYYCSWDFEVCQYWRLINLFGTRNRSGISRSERLQIWSPEYCCWCNGCSLCKIAFYSFQYLLKDFIWHAAIIDDEVSYVQLGCMSLLGCTSQHIPDCCGLLHIYVDRVENQPLAVQMSQQNWFAYRIRQSLILQVFDLCAREVVICAFSQLLGYHEVLLLLLFGFVQCFRLTMGRLL